MPAAFPNIANEQSVQGRFTMLELTVKNHAGVMSHVCGLLSRRGWQVEGMFSLPGPQVAQRCIWLFVHPDQPLDQMIKQASKLQDVLHVRDHGSDGEVLRQLEQLMSSHSSAVQGL